MADACKRFIAIHGHTLLAKHLTRNFILHLVNLYDVGLLRNKAIHEIISQLYSMSDDKHSIGDHSIGNLPVEQWPKIEPVITH